MRILITDDETPARARLLSMLQECGNENWRYFEASNGLEALETCEREDVDIVLMDIQMPVMSGLEAAGHLMKLAVPPALVFTTAFDEHAIAAFERNAIDYLLKPIKLERLKRAIEKADRWSAAQRAALQSMEQEKQRTHLCAHIRGNVKLVPVSDIVYFRADSKYIVTRYEGGEVLIEDSLKQLESEFGDRFLRIHRNALVALSRVAGIEKQADGRTLVVLDGVDDKLEISRRHMPEIRKWLKHGISR